MIAHSGKFPLYTDSNCLQAIAHIIARSAANFLSSPQRSLGALLGRGVGSSGCEDLEAEVNSSILALRFSDNRCEAASAFWKFSIFNRKA